MEGNRNRYLDMAACPYRLRKMSDTFVCHRCLQAGMTKEESTYRKVDGVELPGHSDIVCKHCAQVEQDYLDEKRRKRKL